MAPTPNHTDDEVSRLAYVYAVERGLWHVSAPAFRQHLIDAGSGIQLERLRELLVAINATLSKAREVVAVADAPEYVTRGFAIAMATVIGGMRADLRAARSDADARIRDERSAHSEEAQRAADALAMAAVERGRVAEEVERARRDVASLPTDLDEATRQIAALRAASEATRAAHDAARADLLATSTAEQARLREELAAARADAVAARDAAVRAQALLEAARTSSGPDGESAQVEKDGNARHPTAARAAAHATRAGRVPPSAAKRGAVPRTRRPTRGTASASAQTTSDANTFV